MATRGRKRLLPLVVLAALGCGKSDPEADDSAAAGTPSPQFRVLKDPGSVTKPGCIV